MHRPSRCARRSLPGGPSSGSGCTRARPASCTARTATRRGTHEVTSLCSWETRFRPRRGREQERELVHRVPARGQHGAHQEDREPDPIMAAGTAQPTQPAPVAVGGQEVQRARLPQGQTSTRRGRPRAALTVRPVAHWRLPRRLDGGSRVTRECAPTSRPACWAAGARPGPPAGARPPGTGSVSEWNHFRGVLPEETSYSLAYALNFTLQRATKRHTSTYFHARFPTSRRSWVARNASCGGATDLFSPIGRHPLVTHPYRTDSQDGSNPGR